MPDEEAPEPVYLPLPEPVERLGLPYYACQSPECFYGTFDPEYATAHTRDHRLLPEPTARPSRKGA